MCWMDIRRGCDALAEAVVNIRPHEELNGHSYGMAWVNGDGVHIKRGVGRIPDDVNMPIAEAALAHTRFATRGKINVENSHPFAIERNDQVVAALAHNGTWHEAPDVDGWSDTRAMVAVLNHMLDEDPNLPFREAFKRLGEMTGETIVALHEDGACYVHSGWFPITRDGSVVSSSGQAFELEEGVHVIEPGEELVAP